MWLSRVSRSDYLKLVWFACVRIYKGLQEKNARILVTRWRSLCHRKVVSSLPWCSMWKCSNGTFQLNSFWRFWFSISTQKTGSSYNILQHLTSCSSRLQTSLSVQDLQDLQGIMRLWLSVLGRIAKRLGHGCSLTDLIGADNTAAAEDLLNTVRPQFSSIWFPYDFYMGISDFFGISARFAVCSHLQSSHESSAWFMSFQNSMLHVDPFLRATLAAAVRRKSRWTSEKLKQNMWELKKVQRTRKTRCNHSNNINIYPRVYIYINTMRIQCIYNAYTMHIQC